MPAHQQGKHAKSLSILADSDVKEETMSWIRSQKAVTRSIPAIRNQLRNVILPKVLGVNIQENANEAEKSHPLSNYALYHYLNLWGFHFKTGKII